MFSDAEMPKGSTAVVLCIGFNKMGVSEQKDKAGDITLRPSRHIVRGLMRKISPGAQEMA